MKRFIILACMLAVVTSAFSMKKGPGRNLQHNCIHVIDMKNDIFYFKSDREVAGGTIDVYHYQSGEKVLTQTIDSKKTTVDLHTQEPGDYIILITKGEFKRKYVMTINK